MFHGVEILRRATPLCPGIIRNCYSGASGHYSGQGLIPMTSVESAVQIYWRPATRPMTGAEANYI